MIRAELGIQSSGEVTGEGIGSDIPEPVSMEGWKNITIEESGQPLFPLNDAHERVRTRPGYFLQGIPRALSNLYARKEVLERLILASNLLPSEYSLIIFDGYRPVEVQTEIFNAYRQKLSDLYPNEHPNEIERKTETYVSRPSVDPQKPSPHSTGGAIDLAVLKPDGSLLEMGTQWDHFGIESQTAYFKGKNELYHANRRMLYLAMTNSGFTNYPEEWWHYDLGNQFWGHISKQNAVYGFIEGGDFYGRETNG